MGAATARRHLSGRIAAVSWSGAGVKIRIRSTVEVLSPFSNGTAEVKSGVISPVQ